MTEMDRLREQIARLAQIVESFARQQIELQRLLRDVEHRVRLIETPNPDITLP